ncbi:MAG TPA: hypothetical protein VI731_08835 [Bacteroidia bacterium]|nr:hypothetical protein [Bacteroidia bacterium]
MKVLLRLLLLQLLVAIALPASATRPKLKKFPEGGCNVSASDGSEVKLPIGLPFTLTDINSGGTVAPEEVTESSNIVYSFDLTEEIGPASIRQTHTALGQARSLNAACVLLRINSYACAVDAAQNIRAELMAYERPVIVYVEGKAMSAASLISMAGDSVYMRKCANNAKSSNAKKSNASFTPTKSGATCDYHTQKPSCGDKKDEKNSCLPIISNGGNNHPEVCEASDLQDVLLQAGLKDYQLVFYRAGFYDKMIDWLMQPIASLLLVLILGMAIRLQTIRAFPGPSTFFLLSTLMFFFVPLFQGGLATGIEILSLVILTGINLFVKWHFRWQRILLITILLIVLLFCQTGDITAVSAGRLLLKLLFTSVAFFMGWTMLMIRFPAKRADRIAAPSVQPVS